LLWFVSSTTEDLVASSSILSMVEPRRAIVRIKVENSTMTMFNDRLTRNRLKSPNYTKSPVTVIFFYQFLVHVYICVVYDASPRLEPLAFDIA
jgi:hypothetical protein